MELIDQGAEAQIKKDEDTIVKIRIPKGYRIKEIDEKLRKFRTRREAKVLEKLNSIGFPSPRLDSMCDKAMQLRMEMINGDKLRDIMYQNPLKFSEEIGEKIGILHSNDIIHGDLTTSNMMHDEEIKFIDFGLSFFSEKAEDKAVDLHLFRQALESKHFQNWEVCFEHAIKGYKKTNPEHETVIRRLEKVDNRGRNKGKH